MTSKKFITIICFIFLIIFGPLIFLSVKYVDHATLFDWTIFDLVELFVTDLLGTLFGYFLSVIAPKQDKKIDIEASYIDIVIDDLTYIIKSIEQKKEKTLKENEQRDILLMFRMVSNDLNSYISLPNKGKDPKLDQIKNLIFDLKSIITDEPFVTKKISYDAYSNAFEKYCILKSQLTFYKNSLFF